MARGGDGSRGGGIYDVAVINHLTSQSSNHLTSHSFNLLTLQSSTIWPLSHSTTDTADINHLTSQPSTISMMLSSTIDLSVVNHLKSQPSTNWYLSYQPLISQSSTIISPLSTLNPSVVNSYLATINHWPLSHQPLTSVINHWPRNHQPLDLSIINHWHFSHQPSTSQSSTLWSLIH